MSIEISMAKLTHVDKDVIKDMVTDLDTYRDRFLRHFCMIESKKHGILFFFNLRKVSLKFVYWYTGGAVYQHW
jgi:hypothetical protein